MSRSFLPQACRYFATFLLALSLLPVKASGTEPISFNLEQQWHLKARTEEPAGANVRNAWLITRGAGVVIGIVDDGLQTNHPDLSQNYSSALSINFNGSPGGPNDPSPTTSGSCEAFPGADCHGTSVSGVAGATGLPPSLTGVSGVAREATLAGLRLIAGPEGDQQEADAFGFQPDAIHILSNSWGPSDDGATLEGPEPLAEAARMTSATTGRGGKGRIFVWAAGNGLQAKDNCNFDGYANSKYVIAVGAVDDTANQAEYSEPCSAMFVTAPSSGDFRQVVHRGITTTDLMGNVGYNRAASSMGGDYTSTFSGTSSATPVVSGTVALMLAQNPTLTWRDVKHILRRTAARINPLDTGWTAGAFPHNEKFGFGLIDAQAAVTMALTWSNVAAETAPPISPPTKTVNLAIPDNNPTGRTDTITIDSTYANFTVEHVEVIFNAMHYYRGDLAVTLTSPSGVVSQLATVRPADGPTGPPPPAPPPPAFTDWRFGTVRHWGESAQGTWTLKVADLAARDTGIWNNWTLKIYGRAVAEPLISVTPASTDFGSVATGNHSLPLTFTVKNIGSAPLTGNASTSAPFSIFSGGSLALDPGASQPVQVQFSPAGGRTIAGTVSFTSNGGDVSRNVSGTVPLVTLTASRSGTGAGTVTSNPSGINCGTTCAVGFVSASSVTLTATPTTGSAFTGWSGCDSVSGNACTVAMSAPRAVTATFLLLPKVTSFTPASGAVGTTVTITGTNLASVTDVKFNGVSAGAPTIVSATSIKAVVPAGATTGPISVVTPAGTAVSAGSFKVLPKITSLSTTSGVAGSSVTISGTSFTGATAVKFGTVLATVFTVDSDQQITTMVPAGAVTGNKISVVTAGGTAVGADIFLVSKITSFTPASGTVGATVTITGTNLLGTTGVVFSGTSAVTPLVPLTATTVKAVVPDGATTGSISVVTPAGTATSATSFKLLPKITGFNPPGGVAGSKVTITGTNLKVGATDPTVKFGTVVAVVVSSSPTQVVVTVPALAVTGNKISVVTADGTATSATTFLVTKITSFSPASGKVGATVTISGTNLLGATVQFFNGVNAVIIGVPTATSVKASVPATATNGPISVITPAGTAISVNSFTVLP